MKHTLKKLTAATVASLCILSSTAFAADNTNLSVTINPGSKGVDIVDGSGVTVATPGVAMSASNFDFNTTQHSTGTLGTATEKVRVYNPTTSAAFTVSIAAAAPTDMWVGANYSMDFNGAVAKLTVNPSVATVVEKDGGSTAHITKGSSTAFAQGTADSITVISTTTDPKFTQYDITGVALDQAVPARTNGDTYALNLTLTIV